MDFSNNYNKKSFFYNVIVIVFANLLCAIAINGFFIPNHLLSGGIGGVSILLRYLFNLPTGLMVFMINIPLFIYGFRKVDKTFAMYGFISMIVFSILLTLTIDISRFIRIDDILIGAIVGGVLNGTGMGLLFKNKMCQDGLDIVTTVVQRDTGISVGTSLLIINVTIVIISSFLFELILALYTILAIFMNSKVLDKVRVGLNTRKSVFIVSDKGVALAEEIMISLNRSVTFLDGMGSYKRKHKKIVYFIAGNNEIVKLKNIVEKIDPIAFMTISEVVEVKGSNFEF